MKHTFTSAFSLFFIFIFLFSVFSVFHTIKNKTVFAQTLPPGYQEELIVHNTPVVPSPGETVNLRIESFSTDLKRAVVTWYLNGVVQKQGFGETTFSVVAPKAGQESVIEILVIKENGEELREILSLAPAEVDLIYEAYTYTPPLYKGRSIFSHQSTVKVVAIPNLVENGVKINNSNIIYTWEKDGVVFQDISGRGKDYINIIGEIVSIPFTITVTAESINSDTKAKKSIRIIPNNPKVILYKDSILQGSVFEKALVGESSLEEEEFGIVAVPYFFSINTKDSGLLNYTWTENGKKVGNSVTASNILFENPKLEKSGRSNIGVDVEHVDNILQSARIGFGLNVIGSNSIGIQTSDETSIF